MQDIINLLQRNGISTTDKNGNIKSFDDVLSKVKAKWNKYASENSCRHKYVETKRDSMFTTDGDTITWITYKCHFCGDRKTKQKQGRYFKIKSKRR